MISNSQRHPFFKVFASWLMQFVLLMKNVSLGFFRGEADSHRRHQRAEEAAGVPRPEGDRQLPLLRHLGGVPRQAEAVPDRLRLQQKARGKLRLNSGKS